MSLGELAAFVCTHLRKSGVLAVLTGGACVSIHSRNRYQSFDLDFVEEHDTDRKLLKRILSEIGFIEQNRYFKHPDTQYILEFPPGPLSIGSQPVVHIEEKRFRTGRLNLLSPTDCVKDRLAGYFHWDDKQCLEQARLVSQQALINLAEIRAWARKENMAREFKAVENMLAGCSVRCKRDDSASGRKNRGALS